MRLIYKCLIVCLFGFVCASTFALSFPINAKTDIVGKPKLIRVGHNTYVDLIQKYDVGYYELVEANPGVKISRLYSGERLLIPTSYILPNAPRKGVVVNLAEMRLYFYPKGGHEVYSFPTGIGKAGWGTPLGTTKIVAKAMDPQWRPTPAVRQDFLQKYGYPLPEVVMPGPDNPLGNYAIRLGWPSYLIHGTNNPAGVGQRISAGCIRMLNPDVGTLFNGVVSGTPVRVVYQPYKAGWKGNTLYLEAHLLIPGRNGISYRQAIKNAMKQRHGHIKVNWVKAKQVAKLGLGIPQPVGRVVG